MTWPAHWQAEWRQFRLLVHVSYRRLLDAALSSRDGGAEQFALWGVALLVTPPLYAAMIWPSRYPWLRRRSLEVLHTAVISDRLFFVTWSLLAALLVGSLLWDGLFPDRNDQHIMGVLPVRSRTVAAARVAAAYVTILAVLVAVNLPATALYALTGAMHPSIGTVPGIFVGQMMSTVGAGTCAFSLLLVLRAATASLLGAAAASRIAVLLQFVMVVAALEALMFLPGLMSAMARQVLAEGASAATTFLPLWFLGIYAWCAGPHAAVLMPMGGVAVATLVASAALALAIAVLPARIAARRAVESRLVDQNSTWLVAPLLALGGILRRPSARARYTFVLMSLIRSRRHLLIVASYLGIGVALSAVRVVTASLRSRLSLDEPAAYQIVIPLIITFFLSLGVRAAFAVPTDLPANWVFQVVGPRNHLQLRSAARAAFYALAVLPVTAASLLAAGWLWNLPTALGIAAIQVASGVLMCELALRGHEAVPFTRARGLSTSSVKIGVPLSIGVTYALAFRFDRLQFWALSTAQRTLGYVAVMVAIAVVVGMSRRRRSRNEMATFDAPDDHAVTQLKLSEASV